MQSPIYFPLVGEITGRGPLGGATAEYLTSHSDLTILCRIIRGGGKTAAKGETVIVSAGDFDPLYQGKVQLLPYQSAILRHQIVAESQRLKYIASHSPKTSKPKRKAKKAK